MLSAPFLTSLHPPHDQPHGRGQAPHGRISLPHGRTFRRKLSLHLHFDFKYGKWHKKDMKGHKPPREKKSQGAIAVEKHRALMNKLSDAERRRLRRRAAELLYGREAIASGG